MRWLDGVYCNSWQDKPDRMVVVVRYWTGMGQAADIQYKIDPGEVDCRLVK